jgi:hypothetical protein
VIYFKKDKESLTCLKRWKKQCIKWCYWRLEDGKLGDQMYLNEWPKLYNNLHQFQHKGINLAPWNVDEYKLTKKTNRVMVDGQPLIFYHFHQFKIFDDLSFQESSGYQISNKANKYIYKPYENMVLQVINNIKTIDPTFDEELDNKEDQNKIHNTVFKKLSPIYWKIKSFYSL